MGNDKNSMDTGATVVWDPQVAALVGPGIAETEQELDRILSPAERLMWLRGYTWRQQQELAEMRQ